MSNEGIMLGKISFPQGMLNTTVNVYSTNEGIEIEWIGTIPWEWIDQAIESRPTKRAADAANHVHTFGNGKSRCECGVHALQVPPRR